MHIFKVVIYRINSKGMIWEYTKIYTMKKYIVHHLHMLNLNLAVPEWIGNLKFQWEML